MGEPALDFLINEVSCRTIETRKMEGHSPPAKAEGGLVQNRHNAAKILHVATLCLFIGCLCDNNGWRTHRFDDLVASPSLLEVRYY